MIPACAKRTACAGRLLKKRSGPDLLGSEVAGRTHSGGWLAWAGWGAAVRSTQEKLFVHASSQEVTEAGKGRALNIQTLEENQGLFVPNLPSGQDWPPERTTTIWDTDM